jgi:hypothetical protein
MALVDGVAYERAMAQLDAERALADDLADVLNRLQDMDMMTLDWLAEHERVLARYREARGR